MRKLLSHALLPLVTLAGLTCLGVAAPAAPAAAAAAETVALGPSPIGSPVAIGVKEVATGLVSPVQLVQAPGKHGRRFIVDQVGMIWGLNPAGHLMPKPFLDISSKITPLNPGSVQEGSDERGLLGLAFHPDFVHNGRFFVFYTAPLRPGAPAGYDNTITIAEYRTRGRQQVHADAASERILLQVDHPQFNHDGGTVAFGPDGYLYISIGDGGGGDDDQLGHVEDWYAENAGGNGQDITSNLLGNILRIDVDHSRPYAIPADNPFVGHAGLDEIWAYGLRNPYRFSFDMGGNHALVSQDAGQELWEEVNLVVRRGNYGWNVKEGTHCFDTDNPFVSPPTCPSVDPTTGEPLRDPVIEFANSKQPGGLAFVVVGGYVYRGRDVPKLAGRYIYGGATASLTAPEGRLFVSTPQRSGLWVLQELLINGTDRLGYVVKGFGQDRNGEVYVMASKILGPTGTTGTVFKIVRPDKP
jgi:glucose/arabinose dehydrogenase